MFNLDTAITEWRQQMLDAGIKTPVPLDELESHLRENVEQQVRAGLSVQQAFEVSVERIGKAAMIEQEFKKVGTTRRNMVRTIAILMAIFGTVLVGGMVLPALGRWHNRGVLRPGPLLAGIALGPIAAGSVISVIYGVSTHQGVRGRKWISIFLIVAGGFYVVPLIQAFYISKVDSAGWIFCTVLAVASVLFYGGCLYRIWRFPHPTNGESQLSN
jgi:hypothetical protein